MSTKPKKGDKILVRENDRLLRLVVQVDVVHDPYVNAAFSLSLGSAFVRPLVDEGRTWARGWNTKAAGALRRLVAAQVRKRKAEEQKRQRERDERVAREWIGRFRRAAKVVRRAKLPREFRGWAFLAACSPWGGA